MKNAIFLTFIVFSVFTSYGQRNIKKVDVIEKGYNIKINFVPINDSFTYKEAEFKITPVSGDELNSLFLAESNINGKFEYSFYNNSRSSYFLKKNRKIQVKSDFDYLSLGLEWLIENDKISELEHEELFKQLIFFYDKETGENLYRSDDIILSNPYFIKNKYLSIFKIEITNPSSSLITFDKKIFLQSGTLIYTPLSKNFIINELQRSNMMNFEKSLTLEKYNLQDTLIIYPNTKFVKYFAVTPIKYYNNRLEALIPGIDKKLSWSIRTDDEIIDEKYTFFELQLDWSHEGSILRYTDVFSILTTSHDGIFLGNNEVYIGENNLDEKFEILTLSLWGNTIYFGRNSNLKGIDYIDYGKSRRNSIPIMLERIPELTRK